ncbi:TPA: hypothetical protein HA265_08410 [Candidatus Woesearchaeota archaeon]|nr:hypothetical protein [Candidatus Woesearchaeota archaeon]
MEKEDLDRIRRSISVEHFETFDAKTQLEIIRKLQHSIHIVKAAELDFAPSQFEDLTVHLENQLDELQIIYNIKTNKTLNDFW